MKNSAYINLWSAMTSLENTELGQSDNAKDVVLMASKNYGFGSELSLEVDEAGTWKVRIFHHEDSSNDVELSVDHRGRIVITRKQLVNEIEDKRTITF